MRRNEKKLYTDGFHPVCNNNFTEQDMRMEEAMDKKFQLLKTMLKLTGLVFIFEERPFWRGLKITRAAVLISLAVYQSGFILKSLLNRGKFDLTNSRSLIFFSWLLQALLSMGFLIYFQVCGHLLNLRRTIHCNQGCPRTLTIIRQTITFYCSLLLVVCLASLAMLALKCWGLTEANSLFEDNVYEIYGDRRLFILAAFVHAWALYVWVAVLTFFICVVTALHHELSAFNFKRLTKIGEEVPEGDMDMIGEELQACYVRHLELANRIRVVNDTFEVYTFAMLGSNVPTTIFCLMNFLLSYQSSSWLSVAFIIPDLMFCLFELIGLTSSPAKVHATIREVESIIYRNMRIWKPYNEKVYRLASVFIAHANQSNLGISLWGFAVVTKPLILTMISLTISYLTFVLQVRPDKGEGGNQTLNFAF